MPEQSTAHSRFGGSVAARVLHCPASVRLVEQVPAHLRRTTAYAERGTALHAAMALLIDDLDASKARLDDLAGTTIGNYTITADDVETALAPALAYVDALLVPGAEFFLEQRVAFPTITGAFGTADLLVRIGNTVYIVDFKFGSGVRVLALRPDGDDDIINAQPMFYAAAARHTHPEFFAGVETIVLVIVQPVSIEPDAEMVSSVAVTPAELDAFIATYRSACEAALSDTPPLARGDWCRFCPARPICPAHTAPLLDLAHFELPTPGPDKDAYLRAIADGLNLVEAVKDISVALRDQAKSALQNDDVVPGFVLSAGRAERHWCDENAAVAALIRAGFARTDVIAETMRSPRQVELRAKARSLQVPPELIVSQRSGLSLVRSENWREANPWAPEFWGAHRDGESYGLWGAAMRAWEIPGQITTAGRIAFTYRADYLGGALFMALPSGRLLSYPRPKWRDVDVLDKDGKPTGERRSECSFQRAHGRAKLWRGTLAENATQAVAADLLRATVTRIETNPALAFMPIRLHTHDEIVVEVDEARAEEAKAILRREMLTLPAWAAGLPIQSEETICAWYTKAKAVLR